MSVFYRFGNQKTRVPGLPDCQNSMILRLLVLMHYQHVTDRQTDGQRNVLVAIMRSTHCANAAAHKNQNQATNTEQTVSLLSLNSKSNSRDVNQGQN